MKQEEIDRLGRTIANASDVAMVATISPLTDAQRAFADALDWERYCMRQSGPVTWEDMATAAHLMVRIAAQNCSR
jgi:hypothetical protein